MRWIPALGPGLLVASGCAAGLAGDPCPEGTFYCTPSAGPEDFEDSLACMETHPSDEILTGDVMTEREALEGCALAIEGDLEI